MMIIFLVMHLNLKSFSNLSIIFFLIFCMDEFYFDLFLHSVFNVCGFT